MNPGELDKRIEVWGKTAIKNELKETDYQDTKIKSIWASIIPQTGSMLKGQANTILTNTTHKIVCRYSSGKDIKNDMWIMFKGHRFDINYILNPYFKNEKLEIFCTEVIS